MRREQIAVAFSFLAVWCAPAPARAQSATAEQAARFQRQLEQIQRETLLAIDESIPTEQRAVLDFGAFLNFSFFSVDDPVGDSHVLRQTDLHAYARLNVDDVHEVFFRGLARYQDFNDGDSFNGNGDDFIGPRLERAYYRFDLRRYMAAYEGQTTDYDFTFTGGRQLVHWVNGLTLSQEIDGATARMGYGDFAIDAVGGVSRKSTVDIDPFRPDFDDDTHRLFYGAMAGYQVTPEHRPFIYGLVQEDENGPNNRTGDTLDAGPGQTPIASRFGYDSYYIGAGSTGNLTDQLLYAVEGVYEGGSSLSRRVVVDSSGNIVALSRQVEEDIEAWAFDARLDYLFHDENKTRAVLELVLASGDSDRAHSTSSFAGNRAGTDDHGFNGFGLVDTGLAFFPSVSNLAMVRTGVATFPSPGPGLFRNLQIGGNVLVFHKLNDEGAINEPTNDNAYLGTEADVFANWQVTSDFALVVRYGVFFPGDAIEASQEARHFLYTGVTYGF